VSAEITDKLVIEPSTVRSDVARDSASSACATAEHAVIFAYGQGVTQPGEKQGAPAPGHLVGSELEPGRA